MSPVLFKNLELGDYVTYTGVRREVKWFCRIVGIAHYSDPNDNKYTLAGYDMPEWNPGLGSRDISVEVDVATMLSDRVKFANDDTVHIAEFLKNARAKCAGLIKALEYWHKVGQDSFEKAMSDYTK